MKSAFEAAHRAHFGFIDESKQIVVEAVSVEAVGGRAKFTEPSLDVTDVPLPAPTRHVRFYSGRVWHDAAIFLRDQFAPGHRIAGPAIIIEPHQTVVVEDGWRAEVTAQEPPCAGTCRPAATADTPSALRPIR